MAYQSLRDWIAKTEEAGQLKRIMAEVVGFFLRRLNLIADGGQNAFRVMRSGDGFSSYLSREH